MTITKELKDIKSSEIWVLDVGLDSGASLHITSHRESFTRAGRKRRETRNKARDKARDILTRPPLIWFQFLPIPTSTSTATTVKTEPTDSTAALIS